MISQKCTNCLELFNSSTAQHLLCSECDSELNMGRKIKVRDKRFIGDDMQHEIRLMWLRGKSVEDIEKFWRVKLDLSQCPIALLQDKILTGDYTYVSTR